MSAFYGGNGVGWVDLLRGGGGGWGTRDGGSGLKKNLQILDLERLASLFIVLVNQTTHLKVKRNWIRLFG